MSGTLSLFPNDWFGIIFRLCFALLLGALIGFDRQLSHKPAGLRTHMLVCFGSAFFVLVPLLIATTQESREAAVSRVIQGITAGVCFIGAGEILRASQEEAKQVRVHGLTSAAAIWVSAALGVAAGCGLWQLGLIGAVLSLFVLSVFRILEKRL